MSATCPPASITGPVALPGFVVAGFLVLVEDPSRNPKDPANWSDVLVFNDLHHPPTANECDDNATFVSNCGITGITDVELASVGVTTLDVVNGDTIFMLENASSTLNTYSAGLNIYYLYSEPAGTTPTRRSTWGDLKTIYR